MRGGEGRKRGGDKTVKSRREKERWGSVEERRRDGKAVEERRGGEMERWWRGEEVRW